MVAKHEPSTGAATRLSAVTAKRSGRAAVVNLAGDGEFGYEAFTLGNPPRFVLDLTGVRNLSRVKARDLDSGLVSRIRVSQFRSEPTPVTRVVFDLNSEVLPEIMESSAGLAVRFASGATAAPAVQVASVAGPGREEVAAPVSGSYESHEDKDVREPVPAAGGPGRTGAVAAGPASEQSSPRPAEVLAAPAPAAQEPAARVAPAVAPSATAADSAPAPTKAEPPVARPPAEANTAPVAVAQAAPVVMTPAAPAATEARPAAARMALPVEVPAPATAEVKGVRTADTAPPAPRNSQKTPPRRKATTADDRLLMEAAETLLDEQEKTSGVHDLANSYESRALGSGERQYTGEPLTLNLKDADIKDTLQKFSELTNLNIVLDPDVRGTVTVSLTDIPWDQALELILKINGLGYVLEGNVMRIAPTAKLAAEEQARQALARAQEQNKPTKHGHPEALVRARRARPRQRSGRSCPRGATSSSTTARTP